MASGTNFHFHLFDGGAGLYNVTTRADYFGVGEIFRVDGFFHIYKLKFNT
jgi:hypothetical protein